MMCCWMIGAESRFFSLYEIVDRGSSWVGPLLVGVMADSFGNIRYGFGVLVVLLGVGLPILYFVDPAKGKLDARNFSLGDEEDEETLELRGAQ